LAHDSWEGTFGFYPGKYQLKTKKSMDLEKINSKIQVVMIALLFLSAIPMVADALPAFPGAEGWGSTTIGGRGGKVIKVTNTNDNGRGSLRAALTAIGPRIVIFDLGGTITLSSDINISNPYLTIAGQTAPGGGIQIKGATMRPLTHDIIIRGLRMRPGNEATGSEYGNRDGLSIEAYPPTYQPAYNIIIDHCSISWATDENFVIWYNQHDITLSWNIISEALVSPLNTAGALGRGVLVGYGVSPSDPVYNISIHHNIIANNEDRNPLIEADALTEVVNNLVYNWRWFGTRTFSKSAIIGNHYIAGPSTTARRPVYVESQGGGRTLGAGTVYVSNNIGPGRLTDTGDDWNIVNGGTSTYRSNSLPFTQSNITVDAVTDVKRKLFAGAGATIPRDSVDTRIINEINTLTGKLPASQCDVGGWPTLAAGTAPIDTDGDGIPDSWETTHGLNPNNAADTNSYAPSGYTWIEEYINGLIPLVVPPAPVPNPPSDISMI